VRKFFCDVPSCERRIFAERLKDVAHVYARGTERQREALEWIAFALGGEAGARLARQLGVHVSPDTLLNRIREAFCADAENVRVLSVDDFGLGRDNAPGTILVDLERHKIVDLLGEHSVVAVSSYVSAQIVTPAPEQATRFARADLVFCGVDHPGPSFEARVFIDNEGPLRRRRRTTRVTLLHSVSSGTGDVSGKKNTATCRGEHKMRLISDLRTSCCPTQ
jgi:hypothetical protein